MTSVSGYGMNLFRGIEIKRSFGNIRVTAVCTVRYAITRIITAKHGTNGFQRRIQKPDGIFGGLQNEIKLFAASQDCNGNG